MRRNHICEKVVEFILTRRDRDLAVLSKNNIARFFGVEDASLAREFMAGQNMTLDQFILRERLYRAFFLIEKKHRLSGSRLARELGFNSPGIFRREFKNLFLISPDKYIRLKIKIRNRSAEGMSC